VASRLSPPCLVTAEQGRAGRGSGETTPPEPSSYTIFHIVSDLIALVVAAVIVVGEQVLYTMLASSSPTTSSYYLGAGGEGKGWQQGGEGPAVGKRWQPSKGTRGGCGGPNGWMDGAVGVSRMMSAMTWIAESWLVGCSY
jgi:hypothetical protein